ncbi:MAG: helix-turn-helix transcriptional regulator [Deltaproteobacteria bacterium]|nr:helix-turn-helix transcriptional regulator [Deltaproteobacteria bacterium]
MRRRPEEQGDYRRWLRAIGARVAGRRKAQGWTQEQAAEHCQLDLKFYQDLEYGRRPMSTRTLFFVARGLLAEPHELLPGPDEHRLLRSCAPTACALWAVRSTSALHAARQGRASRTAGEGRSGSSGPPGAARLRASRSPAACYGAGPGTAHGESGPPARCQPTRKSQVRGSTPTGPPGSHTAPTRTGRLQPSK